MERGWPTGRGSVQLSGSIQERAAEVKPSAAIRWERETEKEALT